jgi:hypothetical protein
MFLHDSVDKEMPYHCCFVFQKYFGIFPHAGTFETQKLRNTGATIGVQVFIACCWVTPRSLLHNAEVNTSLRLVAM